MLAFNGVRARGDRTRREINNKIFLFDRANGRGAGAARVIRVIRFRGSRKEGGSGRPRDTSVFTREFPSRTCKIALRPHRGCAGFIRFFPRARARESRETFGRLNYYFSRLSPVAECPGRGNPIWWVNCLIFAGESFKNTRDCLLCQAESIASCLRRFFAGSIFRFEQVKRADWAFGQARYCDDQISVVEIQ